MRPSSILTDVCVSVHFMQLGSFLKHNYKHEFPVVGCFVCFRTNQENQLEVLGQLLSRKRDTNEAEPVSRQPGSAHCSLLQASHCS